MNSNEVRKQEVKDICQRVHIKTVNCLTEQIYALIFKFSIFSENLIKKLFTALD
jgi:hypothetical protein